VRGDKKRDTPKFATDIQKDMAPLSNMPDSTVGGGMPHHHQWNSPYNSDLHVV